MAPGRMPPGLCPSRAPAKPRLIQGVNCIGRCILAKAKLWEKLENEHGELELCPGHVFIEYMECCMEYNYLQLPSADEWPTHVVWRTPAELAKKLVLFEEE